MPPWWVLPGQGFGLLEKEAEAVDVLPVAVGCERRRSDCAAEAAQHIEEACCGHRTFRVRFAIAMLDNGAIRKVRPRRFAG